MTIIDVCGYGDFDNLYSDGLLISDEDFDINKLNKEFVKKMETDPSKKYIIIEENEYSLKILYEKGYFSDDVGEDMVLFKDNDIICQSFGIRLDTDEYKSFLIEKGFKELNSITTTINSDM